MVAHDRVCAALQLLLGHEPEVEVHAPVVEVLRILDLLQCVEGVLAATGDDESFGRGRRGVPYGLAHGGKLGPGHSVWRPDGAMPSCNLLRSAVLVIPESHNCLAATPRPGILCS
eukprot:700230-Pyramimonas_sp.AAC.1